jgi:hypothetical protein
MKTRCILILLLISASFCIFEKTKAQSANDTVIFTPKGKFNFIWTYSGYTPLIDRLGRPYVYLATKELGLVTFNISNTMNPVPVDTQTVASLGGLKVTGVAQDNYYLLVSLGDFENTTNAGLAIFDVSNPVTPILLDRWDSAAFNNGTSTVIWQGNYAYLGAMTKGVLILDISDKHNIHFVSQIIPDTTFGNQTFVYHSRGLYLSGDTLLVADDNGGLRIMNVSDKYNPVEIGKYLNNSISSIAAAYYNHVFRIGNIAWCAMDFCGFEAVNVSNPSLMTGVSWLNPWNCTNVPPPFGSWNGSDGHTNEIAYAAPQNVLMFSGGDSQLLAIDPADPAQPRIMGAWGPPNDSVGTWGVDVYGNLVALANVHTLGFPFVSTIGGLQLLNWNLILSINDRVDKQYQLNIFPNPASEKFTIDLSVYGNDEYIVEVSNVLGRIVSKSEITNSESEVRFDNITSGIYFVQLIKGNKTIATGKLLVSP